TEWTTFEAVPNAPAAAGGRVGLFALGTASTDNPTVTFDYFRVVGDEEPEPSGPEVSVEADTRWAVGKVDETVKVTNESETPVEAVISTAFGSKTVTVAPDKTVSATFSTRQAAVPAGEVTVTASADGEVTRVTEPYAARWCGGCSLPGFGRLGESAGGRAGDFRPALPVCSAGSGSDIPTPPSGLPHGLPPPVVPEGDKVLKEPMCAVTWRAAGRVRRT